MSYWILKDGQTTGPHTAAEVLETAEPDTLVSHEQTWFPLENHPYFGRPAIASPQPVPAPPRPPAEPGSETMYWIEENGSPSGPFNAGDVVSRARPDTRVSHRDTWVLFRQHPDFGHVVMPAARRPRPEPVRTRAAIDPPNVQAIRPAADTASDSSSPRIRRLRNDYERVQSRFENWPLIEVEYSGGDPPDTYRVWYMIKGLYVEGDGEIVERDQHVVEIKLGLQYPRRAPQCKLLTPLFHPNFNNTDVCAQDNYAAAEGLDDLIVRIGQMIAYQEYNTKSPLNGIAAKWAAEHSAMLPVDERNVAPAQKKNGSDGSARQAAPVTVSETMIEAAGGN